MDIFLIVVLVVFGIGTLILLAAIVTGLAGKHKTGHLPGRGAGGSRRKPARRGRR